MISTGFRYIGIIQLNHSARTQLPWLNSKCSFRVLLLARFYRNKCKAQTNCIYDAMFWHSGHVSEMISNRSAHNFLYSRDDVIRQQDEGILVTDIHISRCFYFLLFSATLPAQGQADQFLQGHLANSLRLCCPGVFEGNTITRR